MERLLFLETSVSLCSAALAEDGVITSYRESSEPRAHASLTAVYVDEILKEKGLAAGDLDAVCVSGGPGSYTGLRVGASTAKGLCFGASIPLISVGTLDILVAQAFAENLIPEGCRYIVPMVDARRMEVYTAVYSSEGEKLTSVEAKIISSESFIEQLSEGLVLFIGDGAEKCAPMLSSPNALFVQCCPKASSMLAPALKAYKEKRFEDVAYFEPFYLKDFVATVSKKKLF